VDVILESLARFRLSPLCVSSLNLGVWHLLDQPSSILLNSASAEAMAIRDERMTVGASVSVPKWYNMYGDFLSKNASAVSQIETGLRSLTYIIPGMYSAYGPETFAN
jgi:hypothetical protein